MFRYTTVTSGIKSIKSSDSPQSGRKETRDLATRIPKYRY